MSAASSILRKIARNKNLPHELEEEIMGFLNCYNQKSEPDYDDYCEYKLNRYKKLYAFINYMELGFMEEPDGGELNEEYYMWDWINTNFEEDERNRLYTEGKAAMRDIFSGNGYPIKMNTNISKIKNAEKKNANILTELNAKYDEWVERWNILNLQDPFAIADELEALSLNT